MALMETTGLHHLRITVTDIARSCSSTRTSSDSTSPPL